MTEPTHEQIAELVDAMWQLLDDMGRSGNSVCTAAKAKARLAIEPFSVGDFDCPTDFDDWMPLDEAKKIVTECYGEG